MGGVGVNHLRRGLSNGQLIVLGIAGAVGTGALFSTAGMAAMAGPGVVLSWAIGAIMYTFIGLTYVDLALLYPEAGGPSRYSLYTHGPTANMIGAFSDLIWYLFIPPIEALATVEGLNYFYPHLVAASGAPTVAGALLGVVAMLLFVPFNYYGVRAFGQSTSGLGIVKLVLYVLVAIGFVSFARFANFSSYGGFVPLGLGGVFGAIPLAMFAFGGIRVIPDYAEEANQSQDMRSSIIWAVVGQSIIYLLFAIAFVASINWAADGLKTGVWSSVSSLPGNPFLVIAQHGNVAWLVVLTVIIAILGPFVTGYIYQGAGTRVLFAMGRSGIVPTRMKTLSEQYKIPLAALVVFTVVGAVVAYIAEPLPSIYSLITDAVVAGYIGFAINPVSMLALRRQGDPGRVKGSSLVGYIAFASASLIVYWSGWPSVPYAVVLLAIAALVFGLIYRVKGGFSNALWYIVYILFLTVMTYIGSVGSLTTLSFFVGSAVVIVVSLLVFLPWGVASRQASIPTHSEEFQEA